jgi:hypothetical protein
LAVALGQKAPSRKRATVGVYRASNWLAITPPPTVRELVEEVFFQWQLEP